MGNSNLETYLNDHLAGATAGVELLQRLESEHTGTALGALVTELKPDVESDRRELESIIQRLQLSRSALREAAGWLGEKMNELKLRVDDPASGALRLLESLEAMSLGIEGKRALWLAMSAAAENFTELGGIDYDRLLRRAVDQRQRIESARIAAAIAAFRPAP